MEKLKDRKDYIKLLTEENYVEITYCLINNNIILNHSEQTLGLNKGKIRYSKQKNNLGENDAHINVGDMFNALRRDEFHFESLRRNNSDYLFDEDIDDEFDYIFDEDIDEGFDYIFDDGIGVEFDDEFKDDGDEIDSDILIGGYYDGGVSTDLVRRITYELNEGGTLVINLSGGNLFDSMNMFKDYLYDVFNLCSQEDINNSKNISELILKQDNNYPRGVVNSVKS